MEAVCIPRHAAEHVGHYRELSSEEGLVSEEAVYGRKPSLWGLFSVPRMVSGFCPPDVVQRG